MSGSLGTSFFSFCATRFKINGIKTLLSRAYGICSSFKLLHTEFDFLHNFFRANGFPSGLFYSQLRKFLDKKLVPQPTTHNTHESSVYCSLPYFGYSSEKMSRELNVLISKYFLNLSVKIVLINNFRIGSFFHFKDSIPKALRSSLIYEYSCPLCGSAYVGMTTRNLYMRVAEHRGRSYRTGVPLATPPHSSIRHHADTMCPGPVSIDNFSIRNSANNFNSLRILESLVINQRRPDLNLTASSYPLEIVN